MVQPAVAQQPVQNQPTIQPIAPSVVGVQSNVVGNQQIVVSDENASSQPVSQNVSLPTMAKLEE